MSDISQIAIATIMALTGLYLASAYSGAGEEEASTASPAIIRAAETAQEPTAPVGGQDRRALRTAYAGAN